MWKAADAMVLGRKTYVGLAGVWPQLAEVPGMEDDSGVVRLRCRTGRTIAGGGVETQA